MQPQLHMNYPTLQPTTDSMRLLFRHPTPKWNFAKTKQPPKPLQNFDLRCVQHPMRTRVPLKIHPPLLRLYSIFLQHQEQQYFEDQSSNVGIL